jgi:hypothetical protein
MNHGLVPNIFNMNPHTKYSINHASLESTLLDILLYNTQNMMGGEYIFKLYLNFNAAK